MNIKKYLQKIPRRPGVYLFLNKHKRVLYVGKANDLKSRIASYGRPGWKEKMLLDAHSIIWEELSSDIEALIRESVLIKRHKPKYNILLRDDKNFFYIAFTRDAFPRIYLTHQTSDKFQNRASSLIIPAKNILSARFVGPFTDGNALKIVLRLLRSYFPYCVCSPNSMHKRKCVNAEIGKCFGFCCLSAPASRKDMERYRQSVGTIRSVLEGKTGKLTKALLKKMNSLSKKKLYEEAAIIRDQVAGLDRILKHRPYIKRDLGSEREKALLNLKDLLNIEKAPGRIECYDVSHHQGDTSVASMVVFENGAFDKSQYRRFIIKKVRKINDPAMISEVVSRRLKHQEWPYPQVMLIDGGKAQLNAAQASSRKFKKAIKIIALAKREEELYVEGRKEKFKLSRLPSPLLHLLASMRDEAHRFAISFHRQRRSRLVIPR